MSNLPQGAFLTSINGKQCTAIPRKPTAAANDSRPSTTAEAAPATTTAEQEDTDPDEQETQEPEVSTSIPEETTSEEPGDQPTVTTSTAASTSSSSTSSSTSSSVSALPAEEPGPVSSTPPAVVQNPQITDPPTTAEVEASTADIPQSAPQDAPPETAQETQPQTVVNSSGPVASTAVPPSSDPPSSTSSPLRIPENRLTRISTTLATVVSQSTVADVLITPTADDGETAETSITPSVSFLTTATLPGGIVTTFGPDSTTASDQNSGNSSDSGLEADRSSTPRLVGGIVGGLAAVSLVAFLLWFWRKRVLRKRRSTLLTPLSVPPAMGDREKPYEIDRGSLGPTPRSAKAAAAMGYSFRKFGHQLRSQPEDGSPRVNMNRGNSQFIDPVSARSRSNSATMQNTQAKGGISTKDRFLDWWSRLAEDVNFNWRLRNRTSDDRLIARDMRQKSGPNSQPDFLTLLGMDDAQLDRQSRQRRASRGGSTDSVEHFLGSLALDFDGARGPDPFSDANAIPQNEADADNARSQNADPFSDINAINPPAPAQKPPTTYVSEVHRSRGHSMSGADGFRPSSSTANSHTHSVYSDSVQSDNVFGTRRNKFRSDPFDLEIDDRHLAGAETGPLPPTTVIGSAYGVSKPGSARIRKESFSSRYTSSMSMGADWGDPGPDVGPAAIRRESPEECSSTRPAVNQTGSQQSSPGVGKAL